MQDRAIVGYGPAVQVRLQDDLWSAIENFRRNEPDIPTRPEAVRRLLQRALISSSTDIPTMPRSTRKRQSIERRRAAFEKPQEVASA